MDLIRKIEESLSVFKSLFDVVRIVDPLKKEVVFSKADENKEINQQCYSLWEKNEFCTNCIAMRAYINNDTFVKIEYDRDGIFLITAVPICIDENIYVAEMIKDISKNGNILDKVGKDCSPIGMFISSVNEKSVKDKLTGLYNKRYIKERLPVDINYSRINNLPLSIIMAEIDSFEKLCEAYGHVIAENYLVDFSNLITKSIRSSTDWAGRYGERKFIIVLNDTNLQNAYIVAEKIRIQIDNTTFHYEGISVKLTSSLGVQCTVDNAMDSLELLSKVEKNLKEAKFGGYNRTIGNIESENNIIHLDRKKNNLKLERLDKQISEVRDVLNEICCTKDEDNTKSRRLAVSQYLDELIVEYMKEVRSAK